MKSPSTLADILNAWIDAHVTSVSRLVDAAALLDCGVSTLSMQLRGFSVPREREVRRLAAIIGRRPDDLIRIADRDRERLSAARQAKREARAAARAARRKEVAHARA